MTAGVVVPPGELADLQRAAADTQTATGLPCSVSPNRDDDRVTMHVGAVSIGAYTVQGAYDFLDGVRVGARGALGINEAAGDDERPDASRWTPRCGLLPGQHLTTPGTGS